MAIQLEGDSVDFESGLSIQEGSEGPSRPVLFKVETAPEVVGIAPLKPGELDDPDIIEIMNMFGRIPKAKEFSRAEAFYAAEAAIIHPKTNLRPLMSSFGRKFSEVAVTGATMAGIVAQVSPAFSI